MCCYSFNFFFFKQKTAYEMRISDWSSDVCSSDLLRAARTSGPPGRVPPPMRTEPEAGLAVPTRLAEIAEVELTRADQAMRQNQDFAIVAVRIKDVLTPLTLQAQQTRHEMRMRPRKAIGTNWQFRQPEERRLGEA